MSRSKTAALDRRVRALESAVAAPAVDVSDRLMTPADVATRLSVSRSMVYALINREELPAIYIGRLPRITEAGLRAFLDRSRAGTRS